MSSDNRSPGAPSPTPPPTPPIPSPDDSSAEFWRLAGDGVLSTQRCTVCGWRAYPPRIVCTNCYADPPHFEWSPVSGDGRLNTWTVVRDALLPGFADQVPYVVGEIELAEQDGLCVVARVNPGADPVDDRIRIGAEVRVGFVDGGGGTRVPVFETVTS